jgi:hypothetical protein
MNASDLVNLGLVSFATGEVGAALNFWIEARKLSDDPLIDMNIGFAYNHMGQFDKGIEHIQSAYERNPTRKEIKIAMGDSLIRHGRWLEAWEIYNPSTMPKQLDIPVKMWDGKESMKGKSVLVVLDGGYGDSIMFARYLPQFWKLGARPSILNTSALVPLFLEQPFLNTVNQTEAGPFDFWVSQFDIPKIFQITPENLLWPGPYIVADGTRPLARYNKKPHVGICWTSTEKGHHYRFRSLQSYQAMQIIQSVPEVQWVSLQYGWPCPEGVIDPKVDSWMDTANVIASLDLVVSIDTSVVHLAGAMGKKTFAVLGGFVDGKFGKDGKVCPWYPSVECYRNGEFGFSHSIRNVIQDIQKFATQEKTKCPDGIQLQESMER